MKRVLLFIYFATFIWSTLEAVTANNRNNDGYRIEINVADGKGMTVFLGSYWQGDSYVVDSTRISGKGLGILRGKSPLVTGQYFLLLDSLRIDLLIDQEQYFKIDIDKRNIEHSKIVGCKDTELLWQYIRYLNKIDSKIEKLKKQRDISNLAEVERKRIDDELSSVDEKIVTYKNQLISKHSKEWFGVYLKSSEVIFPPKEYNKTEKMEFLKAHFLDNINFTDPRLWYTDFLTERLDFYFNNIIEPYPDSLAVAASRLVALSKPNQTCFMRLLSRFNNWSMESQVMGMENVWARLYEDYMKDQNLDWINEKQMHDLAIMYEKIKENRIGMRAHNITLQTIDGQSIDTDSINSVYTLLYFYDISCAHCQAETPSLYNKLYKKYKDQGLAIVAIEIGSDEAGWKQHVAKVGTTEWLNCKDINFKSQYWMYYDVSAVPAVFLLDKNKVIIAKKLDEANLEKVFDYLYMK